MKVIMCRASYSGWMEAWHNFIHVHSSGFAKSTQTAVLVPANSNIRMMYIVIYLSHISSISCLRLRSMKWSACSIANTFIVPCPHDAHVLILLDYQRASLQSFPLSHQQLDGKCTPCCKGNLIVLALTYWPQVWLLHWHLWECCLSDRILLAKPQRNDEFCFCGIAV